jgi:serine/threonine-protein kinase
MGASVDPLSDVYAAGVLAYELLTGQPPISGESAAATLRAQRDRPASPPSALRPDLPPEVDRIVLRALAKDPIDRYPSMAALAGEIMRVRHTMAGAARPSLEAQVSSGPTLPLEALPQAVASATLRSAPRSSTTPSTSVSERRGGALAVALTAALGAVVLAALALWRTSQGPASPPVVAEPRQAPSAAVSTQPPSAGPAPAAPTAAVEAGSAPAAPAAAPSPGAEAERAREVEAARPAAAAGHRQDLPRAAPASAPAAGAVKDPYAVERDALKDNPFR